jgi:hypothetical protein
MDNIQKSIPKITQFTTDPLFYDITSRLPGVTRVFIYSNLLSDKRTYIRTAVAIGNLWGVDPTVASDTILPAENYA